MHHNNKKIKKIGLFFIVFIIVFLNCVKASDELISMESFHFKGFKFGTTKNKIRENETALFIGESKVFAIDILAYKDTYQGVQAKLQYEFYDNALINIALFFDVNELSFQNVIKKSKQLQNTMENKYGKAHFIGIKRSAAPNAKIIDKKITDLGIDIEILQNKCIYILEWGFKDNVEIQLIVEGFKNKNFAMTLIFKNPNFKI